MFLLYSSVSPCETPCERNEMNKRKDYKTVEANEVSSVAAHLLYSPREFLR